MVQDTFTRKKLNELSYISKNEETLVTTYENLSILTNTEKLSNSLKNDYSQL